MKRTQLSIAFVFFIVVSNAVYSAPCCSSSSVTPSLITGDHRGQFSLQFSGAFVVADAPSEGSAIFRNSEHDETSSSAKASGAFKISKRFQFGASLPFIGRDLEYAGESDSSVGLGDLNLGLGFEAIEDIPDFSWKPGVYLFAQSVLPTGKSIYESQSALGTDAFGKGFFSLGGGALISKSVRNFDFSLLGEAHHSFARTFNETYVEPGMGASGFFRLSFRPSMLSSFRMSMSEGPNFESPKQITTSLVSSRSTYKLSWDTIFEISYILKEEWILNISYLDQTLMGPAKNAALSRSISGGFQYRWLN